MDSEPQGEPEIRWASKYDEASTNETEALGTARRSGGFFSVTGHWSVGDWFRVVAVDAPGAFCEWRWPGLLKLPGRGELHKIAVPATPISLILQPGVETALDQPIR